MAIKNINNLTAVNTGQYSPYSLVKPYRQPSPVDFTTARPMIIMPRKQKLPFAFSFDLKRTINDRIKTLIEANKKENFIFGQMPVTDFYKKVEGISKLHEYISKDPVLSTFKLEYNEFESALKLSCKERMPLDFNFEARRKALENLSDFGSEPENKAIFKKLGKELLTDVICFNEDATTSFGQQEIKNTQKLIKTKALSSIRKKIKYDKFISLLQKNDATPIVKRNLEIINNLLKNPEYEFLKKNKFFKPTVLFYEGDLEKFLNELKETNSKLKENESLLFWVNSDKNSSKIERKMKYGGGLELNNSLYYDKKMNITITETGVAGISESGKKTYNSVITDHLKNAEYKQRQVYDKKHKSWIVTNNTIEYKDKAGKIVKREVWQLSDVANVYNIKTIDDKGKIKTVSAATKNILGTTIEKNLTNSIGDTTTYRYFRSKNGNKETTSYIIKDKNGKVLAEKNSLFKRVSTSLALSEINGEKFKIEYLNDEIKIFNEQTKQVTSLNLSKLFSNGDRTLLGVLKKMSATELLAVNENVQYIDTIRDKDSHLLHGADKISSAANKFIFEHELGHAKDHTVQKFVDIVNKGQKHKTAETLISDDKTLQKIFQADKKRFQSSSNSKIKEWLTYFNAESTNKSFKDGLKEALADINAMLNDPESPKWILKRSFKLQEQYTRTIAYLIKHHKF